MIIYHFRGGYLMSVYIEKLDKFFQNEENVEQDNEMVKTFAELLYSIKDETQQEKVVKFFLTLSSLYDMQRKTKYANAVVKKLVNPKKSTRKIASEVGCCHSTVALLIRKNM